MTALTDDQVDRERLIRQLFTGWSSGDPDQVAPYFHPDAVLRDTPNDEFRGWPAIRALYVASLERWGELVTEATRFWHGADGSVAFTWTMRGRVLDDRLGPEHRDEVCTFEGLTNVDVEDGLVREEIEYFDRACGRRLDRLATHRQLPSPTIRPRRAVLESLVVGNRRWSATRRGRAGLPKTGRHLEVGGCVVNVQPLEPRSVVRENGLRSAGCSPVVREGPPRLLLIRHPALLV